MKVTGIETILLNNNPPYHGGRTFLFIRLSTDEGIVGLGERPTGHTPDLTSQIALLHDLVDRFVVGKSPFEIERIWQSIYASNHDYRHPSLYGTPALSAIEMALWDIVGKATNQPIYNLLGGPCHDKLRAYAYMPTQGVWEDPEMNFLGIPDAIRAGGDGNGTPVSLRIQDDLVFYLEFDEPYGGFLRALTELHPAGYTDFLKPAHHLADFHPDYAAAADLRSRMQTSGTKYAWELLQAADCQPHELGQDACTGFPGLQLVVIVDTADKTKN